jgi:hypothetical protein
MVFCLWCIVSGCDLEKQRRWKSEKLMLLCCLGIVAEKEKSKKMESLMLMLFLGVSLEGSTPCRNGGKEKETPKTGCKGM